MKKIIMLLGTLLVGTYSFTGVASTGFSKNSEQLNALSAAWKVQQPAPKQDKNDITIVYGGQDVSMRPGLVPPTATA